MEYDYVNYQTAKKAYEKGFNLIQNFGSVSSLYNKEGKHTYYTNYGFMYSGINDGYISAPTKEFLTKWLREKHNIHVETLMIFETEDKEYLGKYQIAVYTNIKTKPTWIWTDSTGEYYDTPEEALEIGLNEGLDLIEDEDN